MSGALPEDSAPEPAQPRAPVELKDPRTRFELVRAVIWVSVVLAVVLV